MYFTVPHNQQSCLLNLRLHACMPETLAPVQHSYLLKQYKTSVLTVALAPDQYSSNGFYNCTGPADPYFTVTPNHAAVKIVTKICSMQMSYSGVVSLHSISKVFSLFLSNFIHPPIYNFPAFVSTY